MGRRMSVARRNCREANAAATQKANEASAALEQFRRTPQTLAAAKAKYDALKEAVPRGVPEIQSLIVEIRQSIDRLHAKMASRMVCLERVSHKDANVSCCEMHRPWYTHAWISAEIVQILNKINNMTHLLIECCKIMADAEQKLHIAVEKHNVVFNELASIFEDDDGSERMTIDIEFFSLTSPIPNPDDRLKGRIPIHDLPSRMSDFHYQCFYGFNLYHLRNVDPLATRFKQLEAEHAGQTIIFGFS
jgi:hypothetical protein